MAWYSVGTLTLINGSTTVVGVGTDFISGANVGEALKIGTDIYEIGAIVSATQITLVTPYLGATDTGVEYKIIPTQSLVADLAAGVSDLITDYSVVKDTAGAGKFDDGTVSAPGITFEGDQNNGMYKIDADNYGFSAGGIKQIDISTTDVELNHGGNKKLATTSTGVDVTGTVTADGLTVDGDGSFMAGDGAIITIGSTATIPSANDVIGKIVFDTSDISPNNANTEIVSYASDVFGRTGLKIRTGDTGTLYDRLKVDYNGDVHLYEDTGTTAKFVWDASAESLGIGGSPVNNLDVIAPSSSTLSVRNTSTVSSILLSNGSSTNQIFSRGVNSSTGRDLAFVQGTTEAMRIDSSGSLLINTSTHAPTDTEIVVSSEYNASGTTTGGITLSARQSGSWRNCGIFANGTDLTFTTGDSGLDGAQSSSERARIDSSGNLLVGQTTPDSNSSGIGLKSNGRFYSTVVNDYSSLFNRKGNDGDIAIFQKDGSTVGSIGAKSNDLTIGTGNTGFKFVDAYSMIQPVDSSTGSDRDAAISLGFSNQRFKDLYLSGGVYLGGTGSANKLDDYESGTWSPDVNFVGAVINADTNAEYVKVGDVVHIRGFIQLSTVGTGAAMQITNLPFTPSAGGYGRSAISVTINIASISGGYGLVGLVGENSSSNIIEIKKHTSSGDVNISDSDITTSSGIYFAGWYQA